MAAVDLHGRGLEAKTGRRAEFELRRFAESRSVRLRDAHGLRVRGARSSLERLRLDAGLAGLPRALRRPAALGAHARARHGGGERRPEGRHVDRVPCSAEHCVGVVDLREETLGGVIAEACACVPSAKQGTGGRPAGCRSGEEAAHLVAAGVAPSAAPASAIASRAPRGRRPIAEHCGDDGQWIGPRSNARREAIVVGRGLLQLLLCRREARRATTGGYGVAAAWG
mmetsp:Transcript_101196/g.292635  ORF Transcript_101196/g.292635 Transcript_101196/m.292635 type:complete len:226 (+) Transcript_101196:280-957(+)